ncbi:MAG: flavohemoglobin expression-modulating QEGLA motif protein [Acidobacteriota bacterium]
MSRAKTGKIKNAEFVNAEKIDEIVRKLSEGEGIRLNFAEKWRLNIDRPLPFLCVYRKPESSEDKGTAHLILGEAAYLIASADSESGRSFSALVENISKTFADKFGAFLIIEVWAANSDEKFGEFTTDSKAKFRIFTDKTKELPSTVETLKKSLECLELSACQNEVEIIAGERISPPEMTPLLDEKTIKNLSCLMIGLEISPIYRDAESGEIYLSILRDLRRKLSNALQQTFFEFVQVQTPERPTQPQMLGRRLVVDAVWSADAELSALSDTFNYLLAVTPVNSHQAFEEFKAKNFESEPVFHYRLLTIDPEDLKRKLYSISFDEIEDATLAYLLRDKRIELDRQITLIEDRNTPRFMYESLQLFPPVEDELMNLAEEILNVPKKSLDAGEKLDADAVAKLAREEIEYYQKIYPPMTAKVEIREDTPSGLMVSHGDLMIGHRTGISTSRINALIQHEIGTHSVTYFNGRAQPLKLLYSGLPGYEQLQEGLAVFAEYLVGGLSFGRLRTLAARVIAVKRLTNGQKFAEVFDELHKNYNFGTRSAFNIVMRVFRGGGLTKDAVYLRGLVEVLNYLREGGDIETLFVGKMGPEQVSIVRELQWREVLRPAPLVPRYMTFPETAERLKRVKEKTSILDLI